ncbi:MAG: aspartate 1-decarboxylase [Geobacteraceae bacterium GWC2_55_20]|nr:aspartate 1-decarboxylase [Deltaproteobacteria bacterium]MDU0458143.1 aspartate 1-decarboxylase [Geobacteraceae bacterium]OGU09047.1 MAG: aspartate 1-decarboxylase [Geobacteraceae bacterium GWC2_55_20]OGU21129.1 MAG: aspartate 1-decarboxylase [Geobacteraceae bacterium GWF2_54_21]HBA70842.1 aspartate 1-decarboxylase [Geobacter sp.]
MQRIMLKSKIHRATVTGADLHYEGSVTIDRDLMDAADIVSYEKVAVWNVTNGSRLETYAIEGQRGSGVICLNGAAARLVAPKDLVIIASFVNMENEAAIKHEPKLVFVDEQNRMLPTRKEEAGQAKLKVVH